MIRHLGPRVLLGLRFGALAGLLLSAVGTAGHVASTLGAPVVGGTWLTTTLGPTCYVLLAHPRSVTSRLRNALLGHSTGVVAGLGALVLFGLRDAPSIAETHQESLPQIGAQALAVALTLLVLTVAGSHHAPAGATALLVASGIARPGPPLVSLIVGLAIVLAVAPLLARLPGERHGRGGRPGDADGLTRAAGRSRAVSAVSADRKRASRFPPWRAR